MSKENVETARGVRYPISLPRRASQRRSLDERLFLRFPAVYRLLADRVTRLPPGSRLRRWMLARVVVRGYAAVNRRDFDVMFLAFDPGVEFQGRPDLNPLDLERVVHGHDGFRENWRQMLDAFEDLRLQPEEFLDLGDKLLLTVHLRAHGSGSGVPIDERGLSLLRLQRGLVVRWRDFND